jgi:hypothetical protein
MTGHHMVLSASVVIFAATTVRIARWIAVKRGRFGGLVRLAEGAADIVAFLAKSSPEAALRIGSDLLSTAESLALLPNRGSPIKGRPGMR